jgi:hypothetical protein
MTKEQAIAFHDAGTWRGMTDFERATLQLGQDLLCMPFGVFHESVEKALGRPVWTHEFGVNMQGLRDELAGIARAPSMTEIVGMLPAEKTIAVLTGP